MRHCMIISIAIRLYILISNLIKSLSLFGENPHGIVAEVLDRDIVENEFKIHLRSLLI